MNRRLGTLLSASLIASSLAAGLTGCTKHGAVSDGGGHGLPGPPGPPLPPGTLRLVSDQIYSCSAGQFSNCTVHGSSGPMPQGYVYCRVTTAVQEHIPHAGTWWNFDGTQVNVSGAACEGGPGGASGSIGTRISVMAVKSGYTYIPMCTKPPSGGEGENPVACGCFWPFGC